ncbi:MAG TPA: LeuA family protein [Patescibacteria group bacterium]
MKESDLLFDWSNYPQDEIVVKKHIDIDDETLRDGLQGAQATRPSVEEQKVFLEFLDQLGVEHADIGIPNGDLRQKEEVISLIKHKVLKGLNITLSCASRALKVDVDNLAEISSKTGDFPLEVDLFIGSSTLRSIVHKWDLSELTKMVSESVLHAKKQNLPVMFVTEDSTRAHPENLLELYKVALDCGADRICIADTVGIASPKITKNIVGFIKSEVITKYPSVKLDWHGHNDLDLGVINCLVASENGVDRVHTAVWGIGERAGNVNMFPVILNLNLQGFRSEDLTRLKEFANYSAKILNLSTSVNEPAVGETAHKTTSGVHADAILKAQEQGNYELASKVYFPYDPRMVGGEIEIGVGTMSGKSNVIAVLNKYLIEATSARIEAVRLAAKAGNRVLSDQEVITIARQVAD